MKEWSFIIIIIVVVIVVIIIIIIIITFMQGIYTYIPETNYVPREYGVAAILFIIIIIIIIIIIYCNWFVTRWQWLFYMYTKYGIGYY